MKRSNANVSLPYAGRRVGPTSTLSSPGRNVKFYYNEFDVLDYDSVSWTSYTDTVPHPPQLCIASFQLWRAHVPLICFGDVAYHLPDRVMRQFGLSQHNPEQPPYYMIDATNTKAYQLAINSWNQRYGYVQEERDAMVSDLDYYTWYWNITRRYIILAIGSPLDVPQDREPYIPRALPERNVSDGIYHVAELVDEFAQEVPKPSKAKYVSIKSILQSILGKNKLARPPSPASQPPAPPTRKSARTNKGRVYLHLVNRHKQ